MKPIRWLILLAIAAGATGLTGRAASAAPDPGRSVSAPDRAWRPAPPPTDHGSPLPLAWLDADPPRDEDDPNPLGLGALADGTGPNRAVLWSRHPGDEFAPRLVTPRPTRRSPIRC